MEELEILNRLEPLERLEVSLNIKDTRGYYSNIDLICMSTDLLYKSSLLLNSIQVKRNNKSLTMQEYNKLFIEATENTLKAKILTTMEQESFLFWNDKDINECFSKITNQIIINK